MKYTIELSEQDIAALTQLQEDFTRQQELNQAPYPNIYVLVDYEEVVVDPEYDNHEVRYCDSECTIGSLDDLKEYIQVNMEDELREFVEKFNDENFEEFDWEDDEHLDKLLGEFEIWIVHIGTVQKDKYTFLTLKDAENHLESNHYHYHKKAFIDRRRFWRSPVTERLVDILYRMNPNQNQEEIMNG